MCATTINYKECSHCWMKRNAAFVQTGLWCVCVSLIFFTIADCFCLLCVNYVDVVHFFFFNKNLAELMDVLVRRNADLNLQ